MRAALIAGLLVVAGVGFSGCGQSDDAIRTVTVFDLSKAFSRATVKAPNAEAVHLIEVDLQGDKRSGVFIHPPSSVEFPEVQVNADSVFTAGIGLQPEAWTQTGDGVEFKVSVRTPDNAVREVFSRYVDPKKNADERRWTGIRVPLTSYGGQKIRVILSTGPGPANNVDNDWATWSEPEIVLETR